MLYHWTTNAKQDARDSLGCSSRTRSENRATRPSSQIFNEANFISLSPQHSSFMTNMTVGQSFSTKLDVFIVQSFLTKLDIIEVQSFSS